MNYQFRTIDHPEANGREAKTGEVGIRLWFPLEDGGRLDVLLGLKGLEALRECIRQHDEENPADVCEHGIRCGEWCEPCNRAYKEARDENDLDPSRN